MECENVKTEKDCEEMATVDAYGESLLSQR